jgi:hypothetical protein
LQQQRLQAVDAADPQHPPRPLWRLRLGVVERAAQAVEGLANLLGHRQPHRRRTHPQVRLAEQGVAEDGAQAAQGVAHRRLRQAEAVPGAGQAATAVDGVEHHHQVQVDIADVRHVACFPSRL